MNTGKIKNDVIVLGLGNPLMSDEGIGGFIINRLLEKKDSYPNIDFVDAGTGGMSLLHLIEGRKKVIIIDCAYMGKPPGSIVRFTIEQVQSIKKLLHYSLHEIDILKVIDLAQQLNQCPDEIVIFGIEPEKIELREGLSPTLQKKTDEYIETIKEEM
ncbi:MAG: HyaD/HybD family hydrogenase maturation endopeptidase [Phycisphaerae bacterium]|nr:HyaD/HybD family hydrogenase maturation endopeptidase [Phycisphaerae bacterium]